MLENFQGDSWGSILPLCMLSLLPHDLCHGRSSSRWLPAVIELSYYRSSLNMQYAGSWQMTEDEMAGWHHWLDGRESEWTSGVGDRQGGLACCDSWGRKESDTTERLNWTLYLMRMQKTSWKVSVTVRKEEGK